MSTTPRLTLIGLVGYDHNLFDDLDLPEGINKQNFLDCLLLEYGECPLIYPQHAFMKAAIAVWGKKWYDSFQRISAVLSAEYNPLHNFDRYEESEDNGTSNTTGKDTFERSGTTSGTSADDRTIENTISAMNSSSYEPDNKTTDNLDHEEEYTQTLNDERNKTDSGTTKDTHSGHLYGNIGVTTSQEMLQSELDLRTDPAANIYHIMSECFYKEFCIYIF